jgi:hypothetical protein
MASITRSVQVEIEEKELLHFLTDALYQRAKIAAKRRFWIALGNLVGITDVEAVKIANREPLDEPSLTTAEFRKQLPIVISKFAAEVMKKDA